MVVSIAKTTVTAVVSAMMAAAEHTASVVGFSPMPPAEQSTTGAMPVVAVMTSSAKKPVLTVSVPAVSVTVKDTILMAAVDLFVTGRTFCASVATVAVSTEKTSPSAVCITFYASVVPVPVKASTVAVALRVGSYLDRFIVPLAVRPADYAFMVFFLRCIKSALTPFRSTTSVWSANHTVMSAMVFQVWLSHPVTWTIRMVHTVSWTFIITTPLLWVGLRGRSVPIAIIWAGRRIAITVIAIAITVIVTVIAAAVSQHVIDILKDLDGVQDGSYTAGLGIGLGADCKDT